ncbi:lytic transglycosylase domain-containing protein [Corticibacter populi]|uniref:Lytic transglycosylase domain-containing protein n=1 Tax=Corticibacter populi TaxID=1550736 RepID=A0A3M6QYQ2_9BURK|nr:lytic transglycosylase domain-containing protein [Corticibacter populi]RMX08154.1 lytic transglycosylase domain-containing protein [Corticibacter populi]RZS35414.1 transglycosylase-like protein with SLT domain [Corticibacter populi]
MRKRCFIALALIAAALNVQADSTTRCLRGQVQTRHCAQVIENYWQHEAAIRETAVRFGLEPALLKALVATESQYNAKARSHADARGLTQVLPSTAKGMGVADPHTRLYDPHVSLSAGAAYLRQMYVEFRDWRLALAAYNAGPGAVRRHKGIPPYRETQQYVVKVLALYRQFALVDAQLASAR